MAVFQVVTGVCLVRPPTIQQYRVVYVEAEDEHDAMLVACWMSDCTSEMVVSAELEV